MSSLTLKHQSRGTRLYLLDLLRFGAAVAVVFYHLLATRSANWNDGAKAEMEPLIAFSSYGAIGVQFFFMVSGFVILMSIWGRNISSFTASRISRLFPAYWVAVLLCSFLFLVVAPGQFKNPSLTQILVNMTMFQSAVGVKHIDGVYWTLWIEMLFYVSVAVLAIRGLNSNKIMIFAFLWPLAGAMALTAKNGFFEALLIPKYAPFFALGMVLYVIFAEGSTLLRWLLVVLNFVFGGFMTITHFLPTMERVTGRDLSSTIVWALLAMGLLALIAATITPMNSFGFAWMSIAGALTYPLYLVHEYWGWWIIGSLSNQLNHWVVLSFALGAVILLAWMIYRFVERPYARKLRIAIEKGFAPRKVTSVKPEDLSLSKSNS